jgi:type VI secretion system protein ImpA
VRDGLRLIRELIETHWSRLHPGFDEADAEIILSVRAKPLSWLALPRCFLPAVKSIPIATGEGRSLSYADYELAQRYAEAQGNNQQLFQQLLERGAATTDQWATALLRTPVDALDATLVAVRECRAELEQLIKLCDDRFGDESPLLRPLDDVLADIGDQVERAARGDSTETSDEQAGQGAPGASTSVASGPIATRQDALRQLTQVADFFRRTEPHSPISYLVQRAVRWGGMPLEELLREVVKDSSALEHIWETLGMTKPNEG